MGKGNGKGGGKGGTSFALDPYDGSGTVTGTGDSGVGAVTVRITASDGTIFEGTAVWDGQTWSLLLADAVNVGDSADSFADESGTFTVVAYYMQVKGKTLKPVYSNEIQIDVGNADPVAADDSATVNEDGTITIFPLANDSDPDGDPLSVQSFTQPANGAVTFDGATGGFAYTPDADFNGADSFTYTIIDGNGGTATATVNLTVDPVNDAPVAQDDAASTAEDTAVTVSVLANDSDVDGDPLSVTILTGPTNGNAVVNPDGTITYTPGADYNGGDSLTYQISDGRGGTATATLSLTVTPVNDAPVAQDDTASTAEDTAATVLVLANDSDVDGDPLTVSILTGPANGGAEVNPDGTITYTPGADYNGGDSLTYQILDGNGGTATATLSLTVTPVNDAPVAAADSASTDRNAAVVIAVLANDSDPDGDALTITGVTQPLNGSVVINADGTLTFTPGTDYAGGDGFTYTVSDNNGGTATGNVSVNVMAPEAAFSPQDPLYADQWNLTRMGNLEAIWQDYSGAGVTVGIYDDGIEYSHVDLAGNYDAGAHLNWNGTLLDPAPTTADEAKHGTAVAGVIAASTNTLGTIGIAWGSTLTGVNIFSGPADINEAIDEANAGLPDPRSEGFEWAIKEMYRWDVVNHSWGSAPVFMNDLLGGSVVTPISQAFLDGAVLAVQTGRGGLGTAIVKAGGNWADNSNGEYLDTLRYTISVAAYDSDNDASWYSNRGANLLVAAPASGNTIASGGVLTPESDLRIPTTDRDGSFGYGPGLWSNSFDTSGFGGTSAAAPTVAGVISLMLEANPGLGWRDIQNILAHSAHQVGSGAGTANATTEVVPVDLDYDFSFETSAPMLVEYFDGAFTGDHNWNGGGHQFSLDYGYGAVDAYNAVRMAEVWSLFGDAQTSANEMARSSGLYTMSASTTGNGTSTSWSFAYTGDAMSLDYVDATIQLGGEFLGEAQLTVTSPSGTTVTLLDLLINDYMPAAPLDGWTPLHGWLGIAPLLPITLDWTFGVNAFRGEDPNGTWTFDLAEIDHSWDQDTFGWEHEGLDLRQVQLDFYGSAASADDVYHYTDEMVTLGLNDARPAFDPVQDRLSLADTSGIDWLNFAAMTYDLVVDLREGAYSYVDTGAAPSFGPPEEPLVLLDQAPTVIENAVTGDGADRLIGNAAVNELHGGRGNDTLDGGTNDDLLWGGGDMDVFEFALGDGADWIGDFAQAEFDSVTLIGFTGLSSASDLSFSVVNTTDKLLDLGGGDSITFAGGAGWSFTEQDFSFVDVPLV